MPQRQPCFSVPAPDAAASEVPEGHNGVECGPYGLPLSCPDRFASGHNGDHRYHRAPASCLAQQLRLDGPATRQMRFTVLTATYNRAHLLGDTYQSLCAQIFRDFEWLIIDDGSTDGTRGLVSSWKPFFPILYFWKLNSGKHTALILAGKLAAVEFIPELDSHEPL